MRRRQEKQRQREKSQQKAEQGAVKDGEEEEMWKHTIGRNTAGMTCWVHLKAAVDEEVLKELEDAWNSENKKDEC